MSTTKKHVFVSYAHDDVTAVQRIVDALKADGYDVWVDRLRILGGRLWRTALVVAIRDAAAVVVALSPHAVKSEHVRKELDLCGQYRKPVIPVYIAKTELPEDFQYDLTGVHYIDLDALGSFEAVATALQRSLNDFDVWRDPHGKGNEVSRPTSPGSWRVPLAVLGAAAILAAGALYGTAMRQQAASVIPASLTALMPTSFGVQSIGVASVALLAVLTGLGALFTRWQSLRGAFAGLGVFLILTTSTALWAGQVLAAALAVLASATICATWIARSKTGVGVRPLIAHGSILVVAVLTGLGVTQYVRADHARIATSTIGVAPFEVDNDLKAQQADHSNSLRLKLSAVLAKAGLSVMPNRSFDEHSIEDWRFDNWRISKLKEIEPHLLFRTKLQSCGRPVEQDDPQRPAIYTWVAQPYLRGEEALPDFIRVSGSDPRIMSVDMAFGMLTSPPLVNELKASARQETRKIIVDDIRDYLSVEPGSAEAQQAWALLQHPTIEDAAISKLLARFKPDRSACREAAAASRKALAVRVTSLSAAGKSPTVTEDAP